MGHPEFKFPGVHPVNPFQSLPNEWFSQHQLQGAPLTTFMPSTMIMNKKTSEDVSLPTSFSSAFWSGESLKRLRKYIKQSNEFCKKVSEIMAERAAIEHRYSKEIASLSHKLSKCTTNFMGTTSNAFHELAVEFDLQAENHRLFANSLNEDVVKHIQEIVDNSQKAIKQYDSSNMKMIKTHTEKRNVDIKIRHRLFQTVSQIEQLYDKSKECGYKLDYKNSTNTSTISSMHRLNTNIKKYENSLDEIEQKYAASTIALEYARQDKDILMLKSLTSLEEQERDRIQRMSKIFADMIACMEILGVRLIKGSTKLKGINVEPDRDLREIVTRYGDSSLHQPELVLYDLPAEDFKNQISRDRRKEMLERWIARLEHSIDHYNQSLAGVENLTLFGEQNAKFALPKGDVRHKQLSLELLKTLHEASAYKVRSAMKSLDSCVSNDHDIKWIVVRAFAEGIPLSYVRLPHKYSVFINNCKSNYYGGGGNDGLDSSTTHPNGFLSDDHKIAATSSYVGGLPHATSETHQSENWIGQFGNPYGMCVVQYAYNARRPDELTVKPGDVISIMEKRPDKWWRGQHGSKIGLFPSTYVKEMTL